MKYFILFFGLILMACEKVSSHEQKEASEWSYPDSLDAVAAAPESHEVMIDNEEVRVLRVSIKPGQKEPMHTHQWKSVMYVEQPSRIRYYNDNNEIVFESPSDQTFDSPPQPNWMGPEGLHAVENIDSVEFVAIRVELKN